MSAFGRKWVVGALPGDVGIGAMDSSAAGFKFRRVGGLAKDVQAARHESEIVAHLPREHAGRSRDKLEALLSSNFVGCAERPADLASRYNRASNQPR